ILFKETAGICRELNVPFHVHAAFGESNLDLRENNPLHLKDFLDSSDAEGLKLVLIHGGYPYTFEAGYLAAMYPGIYVDISEFIPFASMGMRRGVEDILSMCPTNKILYGSDGFDVPETHWLGGRSAKETLSAIIMSLVERGKITSKYGQLMYHDILYRNSLTLHNIR
ncbi:MAG: amidohydrolase family protein, partial [Sphaerochaetaceae bacterium]